MILLAARGERTLSTLKVDDVDDSKGKLPDDVKKNTKTTTSRKQKRRQHGRTPLKFDDDVKKNKKGNDFLLQ
jgi:hypothetical protein